MSCVICCDEIGDARVVTKCGHEFCTGCLLNAVAKNTGTVQGTTRNQCPMCREVLCDPIERDAQTQSQMALWFKEANEYHAKWQDECKRGIALKRREKVLQVALKKMTKAYNQTLAHYAGNADGASASEVVAPIPQKKSTNRKCGNCKQLGHNRRTCRNPPVVVVV